jgi:hypothetical protein
MPPPPEDRAAARTPDRQTPLMMGFDVRLVVIATVFALDTESPT